ncbi:MAG: NAD-dependent epimerase/dehydratase family protein [Chloroflexota bacterium]
MAEGLLRRGDRVVGLDNLNDYYSPVRKRANLLEVQSGAPDSFQFVQGDVRDSGLVNELFAQENFSAVIHLAAMAGVRASLEDPFLYYDVNVIGTLTLLEAARTYHPNFVFASTSSVYGRTDRIPFVEDDVCDRPLAPYSASKRAAELLCFSYHHLYRQSATILRFFSVYGPRGRPDMMAYKVAESTCSGLPVPLYRGGQMYRDWTYVDDIVQGVVAAADRRLGYEIINLGAGRPVLLADFVAQLETLSGRKANLETATMPDADIEYTYADISKARELLDYEPTMLVDQGVPAFWRWYAGSAIQEPVVAAGSGV